MTDAAGAVALLRAEFGSEIHARIDALVEALASPDITAMLAQVHRLKGAALVLGLTAVAAEMERVEEALRVEPPDSARARSSLDAAREAALRELSASPAAAPTVEVDALVRSDLAPRSVLAIEDDDATVHMFEHMFEGRPGVALTIARSGEEGLAAMALDTPDLVLLDLGLGDMPGIEVVRRIRADHGPELAIIVVSGADGAELRETLVEAGASGFLPKPVALADVVHLLDGPFVPRPE